MEHTRSSAGGAASSSALSVILPDLEDYPFAGGRTCITVGRGRTCATGRGPPSRPASSSGHPTRVLESGVFLVGYE